MPHVLWTDSMTLIWNLLIGGRMGRYTGSPDTLVLDQRVEVRGFSAGSFAGLCTLQLLWKIPNVVTNGKLGAIACPPQLLFTPPATHVLHLFHYEADQLCVWKPGHRQLDQLQIRFTYVSTEGPAQESTAIPIGSRSTSRQAGGILPGFCSCTPMLRAPLRGMPRPCDYSRGSVSDWNRRWRRS